MKVNYYNKFIDFFIEHNLYDKKVFDYIWDRCIFFNYLEDEHRKQIGVYYIFDKNKKLLDFNLIVPFIDSKKTSLINIHEYIHAIVAYYKLGKKLVLDDFCEINSLFFEKVYVLENYSDDIDKFLSKLNQERLNSNENKYIYGLKIVDDLIQNYNKDLSLNKISNKSKKLIKKYKYLK